MDVSASPAYRLLMTNIPRDMLHELFYDSLRAFFCSPSPASPTLQNEMHDEADPVHARADVLRNALLMATPIPCHATPTHTEEPDGEAKTWRNTGAAFVDVTSGAVANALCGGQLACYLGGQLTRWKLVGPVVPQDGSIAAAHARLGADLEKQGREAYARVRQHSCVDVPSSPPLPSEDDDEAQTMQEAEEVLLRLRARSPRTVCAIYGDELAHLDLPASPAGASDSAMAAPTPNPLLALYGDLEDALHQRLQETRWGSGRDDLLLRTTTTATTGTAKADGTQRTRWTGCHVLALHRVSQSELHVRVPRRVACALRETASRPLVLHHREDLRVEEMTTTNTTTNTSTNTSPCVVAAVASPSVRTVWALASEPRRRVDGYLLAQVDAAPAVTESTTSESRTTSAVRPPPSGPTRIAMDRNRGEGDRADAGNDDVQAAPRKHARTEMAPLHDDGMTVTEPVAPSTLRLASKAEVLEAVAAMMTATAGKAGALRDAYGNLFFPLADL